MDHYYFDSREFERGNVVIFADIRMPGAGRDAVKVIDLSQSGFRMECLVDIPNGKLTFLKLPGFALLECRIVWRRKWYYGFEFVNRLHPAIYNHIVKRYPGITKPSPKWAMAD